MNKLPLRFLSVWDSIKAFFIKEEEIPIPKNTINWRHQESELLSRINEYRRENGKMTLLKDDMHYRLADERVLQCIEDGNINHRKFFLASGALFEQNFKSSSENLTMGEQYVPEMFCSWKDSIKSNKNLLDDWKYTGICVKRNSQGVLYACQLFSK